MRAGDGHVLPTGSAWLFFMWTPLRHLPLDGLKHRKRERLMRCEDALRGFQQELLGQRVDPDTLEEVYAHIGACQDLCARALSAAPDAGLRDDPAWRTGQTDLYEALGLSAEEEGDAHAREWARLSHLAARGKTTAEAVEHERAMALAAWQSAANYYRAGLRVSQTPSLRAGLKRIKRKCLGRRYHHEPMHRKRFPPRSRRGHL